MMTWPRFCLGPCLLVISCATTLSLAAQTAGELVEQGIAAGQADKLDDAVAKFTEALKKSPKPAEAAAAYLWRADAFVHKGQFDLAWADLTEAISRDPGRRKAYYLQGYILDERHDNKSAIRAYSKAIELDANDVDSLYNRGVDLYLQGSMDAAIKDFSRTIENDSKHVSAYTNRGAALATTGKLEAALADLSKAISLNPRELNAYIARAKVRMMQGEWHGALKDCDQALRIAPQNEEIIQLRARAQMEKP
jgi:tetratricopeptide (TPR) repeat protein